MKMLSLHLRHTLAILFITLAFGAFDAAPAFAEPIKAPMTFHTQSSFPTAGITDYVLNDRTRVVQVSTIALIVGMLILMKQ